MTERGVELANFTRIFLLIYIEYIAISMKHVDLNRKNRITIEGIVGYMEKSVTKFGTGAKVDCPKEYLGKKVYLVITEP